MSKPYNKRIESHLFSYKKREIVEDDFVKFFDCTLLMATDSFEIGSKFELIEVDYSAMRLFMWTRNSGEDEDLYEHQIVIYLVDG